MTTTERASAAMAAALSFFFTLCFAGCQNAPVTNAPSANTNAANTNATNTNATTNASPATNNGTSDQPVTLAVLDALFTDESFARDLKSKLQLTDDQIAQLRKVAEEERAGLRESGADNGTTRGATERAEEKTRSIVGADKADQVLAFARERWSANGEGAASGAAMSATADHPNAVPGDSRIVVNAPAFRMDVFEQGRLVKSYKVGIGYPEFPLPAGMRKASTIIFNPEWTPPDEPWVEAAGSKVKVGEKVPAGSKLNPLGPIKIPIGLPSLIHGGKAPARLGEFASHGCVGLTSDGVQDFTRELARLAGSDLTDEQIKNYAKNPNETKSVKLAQPVPVELRYETIVATDDGKLHIYRDVYDRGTNTEENLRRVLQAHGVSFDQLDEQQRAQLLDGLHEMARDALGRPAEGDGTQQPTNVASSNSSNKNGNSSNKTGGSSNKNDNSSNKNANKSGGEGARVTRNVKGQKEIVVEIEALRGKGYPAPVGGGFDANQQGKPATTQTKKGKRR
jgi:lipoprotein-anchoring transpeptidase ErfK/SrfK